MKREIYKAIKKLQPIDIHNLATKLEIDELSMLKVINELQEEGYIGIKVKPLSTDSDNSSYYITTTKKF